MSRRTEDQRLSMIPADRQLLRELAAQLSLPINKVVAVAVRNLAESVRGEETVTLDAVDQARLALKNGRGDA